MKLSKIFDGTREELNFKDCEIEKIVQNSALVSKGDIFFDLSSSYTKSLKNCKEANEKGASVLVSDKNMPFENLVLTKDVRSLFSRACANYYDNPASKMKIIGITGTNGKTTCAHLICEELKSLGRKVGMIGTMGVQFCDEFVDYSMTTPDADILQKTFYEMQKSGVEFVVMEVSAHAISQKRVEGVKFDVGVLTNITQDHLDYFKTMEKYRDCKLLFLSSKYVKSAVISADDVSGQRFLMKTNLPIISFGLYNPADVFAVGIKGNLNGSKFFCNILDNIYNVETNLVGEYNVQNILASLSTIACLGLDVQKAVESLRFISPVEGRFNVIKYKGKYIIIDFAHTPDGLDKVLATAKSVCEGKLYCVFGCGGNRDIDKRHKMGAIAEKYCDYVCLTNDNPRFEDEKKIVSDIEKGMKKAHFVEFDRSKAIEKMISLSKNDDVLVIAGKGGEKYQIIGDRKIDYNDFEAVYNVIGKNENRNMKELYGN